MKIREFGSNSSYADDAFEAGLFAGKEIAKKRKVYRFDTPEEVYVIISISRHTSLKEERKKIKFPELKEMLESGDAWRVK